jgi:hypothetical protein
VAFGRYLDKNMYDFSKLRRFYSSNEMKGYVFTWVGSSERELLQNVVNILILTIGNLANFSNDETKAVVRNH